MQKLTYLVNNNGTMEITQNKHDSSVTVHTFHDSSDFDKHDNDYNISAGDMIMLLNYYRYVKNNNIQCDFINPNGINNK